MLICCASIFLPRYASPHMPYAICGQQPNIDHTANLHINLFRFGRHSLTHYYSMSDSVPTSSKPSSSAEQPPPKSDTWVCVGHKSTFGPRTMIKVHKRRVTLLHLQNRKTKQQFWRCIDTVCYHAGGPLTDGPLRIIDDRTCLQCPWHSYLVDVTTGEGLYLDLDRKYRSKGVRQRVHEVDEREQHVWVKLNVGNDPVPSDDYAYGPRFPGRKEEEEHIPEFPDW